MMTDTFTKPMSCSPTRAIQSIFQSPNWAANLLWLSLAVLLQSFVVGQIFVFGYGTSLLQARVGLADRRNPDIDSNRLGDYFMQGLWPFLVYLISSFVVSFILMMPLFALLAVVSFLAAPRAGDDVTALVVLLLGIPLVVIISLLMAMILGPLTIRSMICQDFQKSFDLAWCASFIKLMFWDMLISTFVFSLYALVIYGVGILMFCVGAIPAIAILSAAFLHLLSQWYELFLERGGEPVEPSADSIIEATLI